MAAKPEGIDAPADTPRKRNCGVVAVAVMAGISHSAAWETMKRLGNKGPRWSGWSFHADRVAALTEHGVTLVAVPLRCRMTIARWAVCYAEAGVRYMVRTGGHIQIVKDGWTTDQCATAPATEHWGRRKYVTHVWRAA